MEQETKRLIKNRIRQEVLKRRNAMTLEERDRSDESILEQLLDLKAFEACTDILLYASYGSEADTVRLTEYLLPMPGKKIYMPKVTGQEEMEFYEIRSLSDLRKGYKGIPEPEGKSSRYEYREGSEPLMIMPGVAFDRDRNRIGYGKGFYDRYLAKFPQLLEKTIAICHACQLVAESIPAENTDRKPQRIVVGINFGGINDESE